MRAFYTDLYLFEFPDHDERESLANMERYLEARAQGWYGTNNYHVLLLLDGGRPVGGSVSDYLAEVNAGVIEFLVVAPAWRGRGVGHVLLDWTQAVLTADARDRTGRDLACLVAEMDDPFKTADERGRFDPFARLLIWDRWGFQRLDFPYIQPALSSAQDPVHHLMLCVKPLDPTLREGLPAGLVRHLIHEYQRWAMRIAEPTHLSEGRVMRQYLDALARVSLVPLAAYIGRDARRSLAIHAITEPTDFDLDAVLTVYRGCFRRSVTTMDQASFRKRLRATPRDAAYAYHLWAARARPDGPVEGMASFFTFPTGGFGGYLAFAPSLQGAGWLRALIARIEEQMSRDRRGAKGWYIECERKRTAHSIFERVGFREVALAYRQPPLPGGSPHETRDALELALMYKEFGRAYQGPTLSVADLAAGLEWIFRVVYDVSSPADNPFLVDLRAQMTVWADGLTRWQ